MDPAAEEEAESLSGLEHVRQEPPVSSPEEGKLVSGGEFQAWDRVEDEFMSSQRGVRSVRIRLARAWWICTMQTTVAEDEPDLMPQAPKVVNPAIPYQRRTRHL